MRVKKEKNDRESEYHRKGRKVVESLISIHLANSEPQCEFSQAVYPLAGLVFYMSSQLLQTIRVVRSFCPPNGLALATNYYSQASLVLPPRLLAET